MLTKYQKVRIIDLHIKGFTEMQIAKRLEISYQTVRKYVQEFRSFRKKQDRDILQRAS